MNNRTEKICDLDGCNKKARRRFCCNKHKDRYHNLNNPRGKFAHLRDENLRFHPFESREGGGMSDDYNGLIESDWLKDLKGLIAWPNSDGLTKELSHEWY